MTIHGVWEYVGITKDELDRRWKEKPHKCVSCGKDAYKDTTLCWGHRIAFRKWKKKKTNEDYKSSNVNS